MSDDLLDRARDYSRRMLQAREAGLVNALVARCERAEADADRLAPFIDHDNDCATRYSDVLHPTCTCGVYEAARLHDEAVAQR